MVRFGTSWKTPCNTVEATECAVLVVCVSFRLGWGGFGIQESGTFHGDMGAVGGGWVAHILLQANGQILFCESPAKLSSSRQRSAT